jgi:hypothetical protein
MPILKYNNYTCASIDIYHYSIIYCIHPLIIIVPRNSKDDAIAMNSTYLHSLVVIIVAHTIEMNIRFKLTCIHNLTLIRQLVGFPPKFSAIHRYTNVGGDKSIQFMV